MWWWLTAAWAGGPVGHWHPDELAPLSKVYVGSAERLQGAMAGPQAAADRMSAALREYREALDLLGAAAPAAERERLDALERAYRREHAELQGFADRVVTDYDAAFTAAVERAIAAVGEVQQCPSRVVGAHSGPRIPGAPPPSKPNPDCVGEDLNARLAAAVDRDAALASAVDGIVGRAWPAVTVPSEAMPPVGGGERWLYARDLVIAGARSALREIDSRDDDLRDPLEAEVEAGASPEQLAALKPRLEGIEAETAAARAALAAPILAAAGEAMGRWKGEPRPGWCVNPSAFGGCTGQDASRALVSRLLEDKKVAKAFPGE